MKPLNVFLAHVLGGMTFALFASSAMAQSTRVLPADLQEIANAGQITIGVREDAVPFAFVDDSGPRGYALDICNRIAQNLRRAVHRPDLAVRYNTLIVGQRALLVREKVVDLECGNTSITDERSEQFAFSVPYGVEQPYVVSLAAAPVKNLEQLSGGQKILVTGNSTSEEWLSEKMGMQSRLVPVRNAGRAYFALTDGSAPAYVGSVKVFLGAVMQRHGKTRNFYSAPLAGGTVESLAIMMRKDRPGLKQVADETIQAMAASGELDALYKKWFESPIFAGGQSMEIPMSAQWRAAITSVQ